MQSIRDIVDTQLQLGFSWFFGMGADEEGYLRRLLRTSPTLEQIYSGLRDDIMFFEEIDDGTGYFRTKSQFGNFKKLKKYLVEAKQYISKLIEKKKKGYKQEQKEISKEIRSLDKDLRAGLVDKEEYDYAVKMLLRPSADDLENVKHMFEDIDQRVKGELRDLTSEEELDIEEDDRPFSLGPRGEPDYGHPPNSFPAFEESTNKESVNINKIIDDKNRRYSMQEFNYLYEDMIQAKAVQNKKVIDPITRKNNQDQLKLKQDRIKNLIAKKKLPQGITPQQLEKMTDEQLAGLENS